MLLKTSEHQQELMERADKAGLRINVTLERGTNGVPRCFSIVDLDDDRLEAIIQALETTAVALPALTDEEMRRFHPQRYRRRDA